MRRSGNLNKHFWDGVWSVIIILFFVAIIGLSFPSAWVKTTLPNESFIVGLIFGGVGIMAFFKLGELLKENW